MRIWTILGLGLLLAITFNGAAVADEGDVQVAPERSSIVPAKGTWGATTEDKCAPLSEIRLPDYAGWQRFVTNYDWIGEFAANEEMVVYQLYRGLCALDCQTGQELWYVDREWDHIDTLLLNSTWLVLGKRHGIEVLDAANGASVRKLPSLRPLALFGNELWMSTIRFWGDSNYEYDLIDVIVYDLRSGAEVRRFETGRLTGLGQNDLDPALGLPVRTEQGFVVCRPDGSMQSYSAVQPAFAAQAFITEWGLLTVEGYNTYELLESETEKAARQRASHAGNGPFLGKTGETGAVLCLYDHSSGRLIWRQDLVNSCHSFSYSAKYANRRLAVFNEFWPEDHDSNHDYGRLRLFDPASGALELDTDVLISEPQVFQDYEIGASTVYLEQYFASPDCSHRILGISMDTGEISAFPQIERIRIENCVCLDGRLVLDFRTFGANVDPMYNTNLQILGIDLDDAGLPVPGRPDRLAFPEKTTDVDQRFLAAADPLADDALMTELIAAGAEPFNELCKRIADLSPAQLDALLAAGVYHGWTSPNHDLDAEPVIEQLYEVVDPSYAPQVIRWLNDEYLAWYRRELTGLLAVCGGEQAREYLDGVYADIDRRRREPLQPPYHFTDPKSESAMAAWCEAEDGSGAHYRAYVPMYEYPALISTREVYLAVDADGDGGFEEVLATGLRDHFMNFHPPGGHSGLDGPIGPLVLEVAGDEVRITHHTPEFSEVQHWEDVPPQRMLTGATYGTSTLSLGELRRDSDADGLTDILEQQLMIDPHNPDSDGDGIGDFDDPQPGVDASRMGRVERGIARVVSYINQSDRDDRKSPAHPWSAECLIIAGADDVAYSETPYSFGISIASTEKLARYEDLLNGDSGTATDVTVLDLDSLRAGGDSTSWEYAFLDCRDEILASEAGFKFAILLNFYSSGCVVYLVDLDGELYPALKKGTWIS
ncbi:hypothetical protein JW859_09970 [bacterium]|nr:hypothetical protein [bacterium]